MINYNSNRLFKVWSYSVSHSSLLLRSTYEDDDEEKAILEGYNIDIEFSGVGYIDLPVMLNSISIRELKEGIPDKFAKYSRSLGYKYFEITSSQNYFLVASSCIVGKNNWNNDDRLINPSLEYDEIIALF